MRLTDKYSPYDIPCNCQQGFQAYEKYILGNDCCNVNARRTIFDTYNGVIRDYGTSKYGNSKRAWYELNKL